MQVNKCDICGKIIKDNKMSVGIKTPKVFYISFDLCGKCGDPITEFLKKKKLLSEQIKKNQI